MQTNVDHKQLALARAKFEPVAQALDDLAEDIKKDHGRSAVLKQRCPMETTAQNAYVVRYSLRHPNDVRFALTFIVTGEDADLLLLQAQEYSGPQDIRANPAQVDQRVYRLEKIDEIKKAVREKISAHLRTIHAQDNHLAA
jgi:hypothetical protein